MFKPEDAVAIKFTTLTGTVKGAAIDQTSLGVQYLVEYADNEGVTQTRYFKPEELQAA